MKKLLTVICLMVFVSSCGHDAKVRFVGKVKAVVKVSAQKWLDCETGDAVASDVGAKVSELLKVQKTTNKGIGESVCVALVKVALPYSVDMANGKLPASWAADRCSLTKVGGTVQGLAEKLCEKIP